MIGIIIPTYNEKENIFKLTNKLLKLYPNSRIFIVDDTKNYNLKKYFIKNKKINYIFRKNKKGRGSAVIDGFKKAIKNRKIKVFIEMDADFSHKPEDIKKNDKILNVLDVPLKFKKAFNVKHKESSNYVKKCLLVGHNLCLQKKIKVVLVV